MHIFSGKFKGRVLKTPKGMETRPTAGRLREAFFNICRQEIEGARFLDLFAGSGAMGLEALSLGAGRATFVDIGRESVRCIQENLKAFQAEDQAEVLCADVFVGLERFVKQGKEFDIIYADPPYMKDSKQQESVPYSASVLHFVDKILEEGKTILAPGGAVFVEDAVGALSKMKPLKHLKLKSARQAGRSELHHFIREE